MRPTTYIFVMYPCLMIAYMYINLANQAPLGQNGYVTGINTFHKLIKGKNFERVFFAETLRLTAYISSMYSKTCLNRPLRKKTKNWIWRPIIAWCRSKVLQYWPSLSYHLSLRSLFCLILRGHLRQVLLYQYLVVPYNPANHFPVDRIGHTPGVYCFHRLIMGKKTDLNQ